MAIHALSLAKPAGLTGLVADLRAYLLSRQRADGFWQHPIYESGFVWETVCVLDAIALAEGSTSVTFDLTAGLDGEESSHLIWDGSDMEAAVQGAGRTARPPGTAGDDPPQYTHSDGFWSVCWYGQKFSFTGTQAACVKVLWEHWERDTPELHEQTILENAESAQRRLASVFNNGKHPAWGKMIVGVVGRKGIFRLAEKNSP
jgi:hypothetical protein